MKLLVDIGNSRVKWAIMTAEGLNDSESFERNKTGIKASLNKAWKSLSDITAVYVANVAGEKIGQQLIEWTEKQWQITPQFISTEKKRFGVINAYEDPTKLGVDRWLSLIAARQHARQAQCVIDCGTAITIDIVTKTGQHQGGMILPGLSLMRSSLVSNTEALTEERDEKEFKTLATNTFSAIQAGTLYSVTATLERIISDLKQSFDNRIRFIITGGDAEELLPLLADDVSFYPDIVLKGLAFYARQHDRSLRHQQGKQAAADEISDNSSEAEQTGSDIKQQTVAEHGADSSEEKAETKARRPHRRKAASSSEEPSSSDAEQQAETEQSAAPEDKAETKTRRPRRRKAAATAQNSTENNNNQGPALPEEAI